MLSLAANYADGRELGSRRENQEFAEKNQGFGPEGPNRSSYYGGFGPEGQGGIQGIVARRAKEFRDLARRARVEGNAVQGFYRKK